MATRFARVIKFTESVEQVLEVLLDTEFQKARERVQGAVEVTINPISKTETSTDYEVVTVTYAKGITGIDKSKTETNHAKYHWDLPARKCSWTWKGPHGDRAKVWGGLVLLPDGDGCLLDGDFNIDVRIPLVGKKIEKIVINETAAGWDRYEATIRKFLNK